jgi:hypothetical protein
VKVLATLIATLSLTVLLFPTASAPATRVAQSEARYCTHPTSYDLYSRLPRHYPRFKWALVHYFHHSWKDAAVVSYGEGSWHADASNGQYQGTFQMGAHERATYGQATDLVGQTAAAARYWRASGSDWSPWDCKP